MIWQLAGAGIWSLVDTPSPRPPTIVFSANTAFPQAVSDGHFCAPFLLSAQNSQTLHGKSQTQMGSFISKKVLKETTGPCAESSQCPPRQPLPQGAKAPAPSLCRVQREGMQGRVGAQQGVQVMAELGRLLSSG